MNIANKSQPTINRDFADSLRVAIIGCGAMAGGYDESKCDDGVFTHAGAYRACGIPVHSAFDVDQERLDEFAAFWNVKNKYHDLDSLLASANFDVVSVCAPDSFHYPIIMDVLRKSSPKVLWLEKPITLKVRGAEDIIRAAAEKKVGIRVTYQRRWEPVHQRIRRVIENGEIGQITTANGYYVKGLLHIGTTMIDTMRLLLGECKASKILRGRHGTAEASGNLCLEFEGPYSKGAYVSIHGVDAEEYTYSLFELDIIGTKGRIKLLDNGDIYEIYGLTEYRHYPGFKALTLKERGNTEMGHSIVRGLKEVLLSLQDGTNSDIRDGENALRNIELAENT